MALAQDARVPYRLHGMSVELRHRQARYYEALNQAQRSTGDVTAWLIWFTETFADACQVSAKLIDDALVRARFWSQHKRVELNERQRKALNILLEAGPGKFTGGMTPRKYAAMSRVATLTASRDLADLVNKGLLVRAGAGRSTHYTLTIPGWR